MIDKLFTHLQGNVVAYAALFVALSGSAYAAVSTLPPNSVGTEQLKNAAVTGPKVAHNTLTGATINESTLGTVPNAAHLGGRLPSAFQRRVSTGCAGGSAIRLVQASGIPICQTTNVAQMMGATSTPPSTTATDKLSPEGLVTPTASLSDVQFGTSGLPSNAGNFVVHVDTAPGGTASWTFGFVVNGGFVESGQECTITGSATSCSGTGNPVHLSAGARIALFSIPSDNPASTQLTFGWTDTT